MNYYYAVSPETLSGYQHNQELDERRAEEREAMIDENATELRKQGNKCWPWSDEHINEALEQTGNPTARGFERNKIVFEYWLKVSECVAEKELK